MDRVEFLYVASMLDAPGFVKVGRSLNPFGRVAGLKHYFMSEFSIDSIVKCGDNASINEANAHYLLNDCLFTGVIVSGAKVYSAGREIFKCPPHRATEAILKAAFDGCGVKAPPRKNPLRESVVNINALNEGDLFYPVNCYDNDAYKYIEKSRSWHKVISITSGKEQKKRFVTDGVCKLFESTPVINIKKSFSSEKIHI